MRAIKVMIEYFRGNAVIVLKGEDKKFSYIKGENVDKRFILNSFTEIIKLNI